MTKPIPIYKINRIIQDIPIPMENHRLVDLAAVGVWGALDAVLCVIVAGAEVVQLGLGVPGLAAEGEVGVRVGAVACIVRAVVVEQAAIGRVTVLLNRAPGVVGPGAGAPEPVVVVEVLQP